jgi:hypothetical protein
MDIDTKDFWQSEPLHQLYFEERDVIRILPIVVVLIFRFSRAVWGAKGNFELFKIAFFLSIFDYKSNLIPCARQTCCIVNRVGLASHIDFKHQILILFLHPFLFSSKSTISAPEVPMFTFAIRNQILLPIK